MTSAQPASTWSFRRWVVTAAGIAVAQILLICLLGQRVQPSQPPRPLFHLNWLEQAGKILALRPDFDDPALFALPTEEGFSGAGWMRLPDLEHKFHEWVEPVNWLGFRPFDVQRELDEYLRAHRQAGIAIAEKPPPVVAKVGEPADLELLAQGSYFSLDEELAARGLTEGITNLPVWKHPDTIAATVVTVVVNAEGRVLSAVPVSESGLPAADKWAVDAARALQFKALPKVGAGAGLTTGQVAFHWRTEPPPQSPELDGGAPKNSLNQP